MRTVPSSEFQKNFGTFKEIAQREPVTVTSNGRDSVVLLSAALFAELQRQLRSKYAYGGDLSEEFDRDVTQIMDKHHNIHEGLSR